MRIASLFAIAGVISLCAGCAGTGTVTGERPQPGIPGVVAPGTPLDLVREGYAFTEGPLPTPDGGLYFTDLRAARIHLLNPGGAISLVHEKTGEANGLAFTRDGELLAIEAVGKRISRYGKDGKVTEITRGDGEKPLLMPNDLIVDAKGGIFFTDPGPRPLVAGRKVHVYYLPPGAAKARVVDDQMARPNGLTITLDGRTLIVADTIEHTVWAYDIQPDGNLRNRRPFARLRGIAEGADSGGDGMAVDREGRIFVTSVPGVQVFDKAGQYLGTIPIPRRPTNVAFSGLGKDILYVTAREGLYRIQTLTRGPDRRGK